MSSGVLRSQNSFSHGIVKIQSLDFGGMKQRDSEAKLYRMKVLEAQKKPIKKNSTMIDALKKKKIEQDSGGGHGMISSNDQKSSFSQCTFNMANILMVSAFSTKLML